jgi:O-antigen/teichoic acid export membrane protein
MNKYLGPYFKRVIIRSSLFVGGNLFSRILSFLLLPLLVAYLTPTEFTRYGLLTSAVTLLIPLVTLNLHLAPARLTFDYEEGTPRSNFLYTTFISLALFSISVILVLLAINLALGIHDPVSEGSINLRLLFAAIVFLTVVYEFSVTLMRVEGSGLRYAITLISQRLALILLFASLVFVFKDHYLAFMIAYLSSVAIAAGIGVGFIIKCIGGGSLSYAMLRPAVSYAWPTMIHAIAIWAIMSSGRWIGSLYLPLADLAPYTLVTLFFGVVALFGRALFEARIPDIGSSFAQGRFRQGRNVINQTTLVSFLFVAGIYLILYLVLVLNLPIPDQYAPSPALLLLAFTANVFDSVYLRGIQTLQALKKTKTQASVTVIAGTLAVGMSFFLVDHLFDIGLAIAFTVALFVQALGSNLAAHLLYTRQIEHSEEPA